MRKDQIKLIVAASEDGIIGVDNVIPWYVPEDLSRFKRLTRNSVVIMGRNTWESLPKRPLKDRFNIVLSRWLRRCVTDRFAFVRGITDALIISDIYTQNPRSPYRSVYVIGGVSVYKAAETIASRIYYTQIKDHVHTENAETVARYRTLQELVDQGWVINKDLSDPFVKESRTGVRYINYVLDHVTSPAYVASQNNE